jgi:DnaD/phage-associated family protein
MKGFSGFAQKGRLVKIPGLFFSELLPQIDNLAELKVTLYCFWRLSHKEGQIVYLWESELAGDPVFMEGLASHKSERPAALQNGLERAVARGTLLQIKATHKGKQESIYFANTPRGRAAVKNIEEGKWKPDHGPETLLNLGIERPTIFTIYEQNIGPLTPMIAEHLRDFESTYPEGWVEDAIEIAVTYNKRTLSYIEAILKRWKAEGHIEKQEPQADGWAYVSGKFKDEIEF